DRLRVGGVGVLSVVVSRARPKKRAGDSKKIRLARCLPRSQRRSPAIGRQHARMNAPLSPTLSPSRERGGKLFSRESRLHRDANSLPTEGREEVRVAGAAAQRR